MPYFNHNGHRLFYREAGQGPLLLILPGNTASSACHSEELTYFGSRYRAVSLDFLGTGQSERLAVWPDTWWADGARAVAALTEHLGESQAVVVGTSGGGVIALLTAILKPERVTAVIADSCVERMSAAWIEGILAQRSQRLPGQIDFWRLAHGQDWADVVEADSDLFHRFGEQGGDWFQGRLTEIRCPVLFTASLKDSALPAVGPQICRMADQLPDSQVFLTNSGNHPLMWHQAELFRRMSTLFLEGLM